MPKVLPRSFYARDTILVARELLGQRLVHQLPSGERLAGRIVETEAYLGVLDPAAHSFGGRRTPRTEVMFGEPGVSYVYFIYGMYFCFNVITMAKEVPEAVLIRAVDPLEGIATMRAARPSSRPDSHLANGPGKLCVALQLKREQNALDLTTSSAVFIEPDGAIRDAEVVEGPRVGIGDRHDAVHWPLRFGIYGHPALSPAKFSLS